MLRQPYPNKDIGVASSVQVASKWLWKKAFQRGFLSNSVASVYTWENGNDQLSFHEQNGAR